MLITYGLEAFYLLKKIGVGLTEGISYYSICYHNGQCRIEPITSLPGTLADAAQVQVPLEELQIKSSVMCFPHANMLNILTNNNSK